MEGAYGRGEEDGLLSGSERQSAFHRRPKFKTMHNKGVVLTQHERIYKYLERFGSITPLDAFRDLGITKLATRISEMKKSGIQFDQERMMTLNRFGEKVWYMKYRLKGDSE